MQRYSLLLVLTVALLCCSCQSRYQSRSARVEDESTNMMEQGGQRKLLSYPKEVVWSALDELLRARGWVITSRDKQNGIMTTSYANVGNGSNYARCSGGRRSDLTDYQAQFDITIKHVTANGTDVNIVTRFQAADPNRRESQDRIECATNGQLEEEIFAAVDSVVASRK